MRPDRYGDRDPAQSAACDCHRPGCPCIDPRCHRGWLSSPSADKALACSTCKPPPDHDSTEPVLSARAQAAIDEQTARDEAQLGT